MGYFVVCTFDLKDATSEDYNNAYSDLAALGLTKQIKANDGSLVTLPTTTTAGEIDGTSVKELRDAIRARIKGAFEKRKFKSEIFVSVGESWGWGHTTTK